VIFFGNGYPAHLSFGDEIWRRLGSCRSIIIPVGPGVPRHHMRRHASVTPQLMYLFYFVNEILDACLNSSINIEIVHRVHNIVNIGLLQICVIFLPNN